jgi:predicted MFS family arabinose efflux permease
MNKLPKIAPNSMLARVFLAFLATAGLFYVNIMPALIDGLIEGLGFTNQQAGAVGSANMYGAAMGALLIVFIIRKLRWKSFAVSLLAGLIVMDFFSMSVTGPTTLLVTRFVHGFIGGMLVGTGFAIIARTTETDRTFGMLLLVQFGLGGLGVMYLPRLVPMFGTSILFWTLITFSAVTLLMLPFLSDYPVNQAETTTSGKAVILWKPLSLALAAVFLFQAANMGLYAFIIGLGRNFTLETEFITRVLGWAAWIGIIGSILVIVLSDKKGHLLPTTIGMILTLGGFWALYYSNIEWLFLASNLLMGITWAFVISYLLGMCARFDETGQMAALGGFASKMGLASGPVLAGWVLGENNYPAMIGISMLALTGAMLAAIIPARLLDKRRRAAGGQN